MKRLASLFLFFCLAVPGYGQTITMPAEVRVPVGRLAAIPVQFDGEDFKFEAPKDIDGFREFDPDPKVVRLRFLAYEAGRYTFFAATCKGGKVATSTCVIIVGNPEPPKPPDPKPVSGERDIVILRETADATPEFSRLVTALRAGSQAKYLRDKKHSLLILDDDAVTGNGTPSPVVAKWLPHISGLTLPVLLIADKSGSVLHKQSLFSDATADGIVEAVKKVGG